MKYSLLAVQFIVACSDPVKDAPPVPATVTSPVPTPSVPVPQPDPTFSLDRPGITLVNPFVDAATKQAATEVADILARITSNPVSVAATPGAGPNIVLELASSRPDLGAFAQVPTEFERDQVLLRSTPNTLQVVGRSESALVHGLWTLARELGYRQYFAEQAWEYIPRRPAASIKLDRTFAPRYLSRGFTYGYTLAASRPNYDRWITRNRIGGGFEVDASHAYGKVAAFLVKGQPVGTTVSALYPDFFETSSDPTITEPYKKFCTTNPRLQAKVREYVDAIMTGPNPPASISMEPSDGDGWGTCSCADCPRLTSISDKVVTLANIAADQLKTKYPRTYVGMYAYYTHSEPPSIALRDNIIVNVTTSFRAPGSTLEGLLSGWKAKGADVGVRDYLSVNAWDRDIPGWPQASSLVYVSSLDVWSKQGARFYGTEAGNNWGPAGLGYYVMSQALWESVDAEKIRDEFLTNMFPEALTPMRIFYASINMPNTPAGTPPVTPRKIRELYQYLTQAYATSKDAAALTRLDQLGQYVRYVEMLYKLNAGNYDPRLWPLAQVDALLQYAFRIRNTGMVHSYALHRDLALRITLPDSITTAPWYLKNPNIGLSSVPAGMQDFTHGDVLAWVQGGAK
jgi:hypothetical protein